jgi:hypothetical protein
MGLCGQILGIRWQTVNWHDYLNEKVAAEGSIVGTPLLHLTPDAVERYSCTWR